MALLWREFNAGYAFFERNWNLTRRYLGWEVVWFVYALVNGLAVLFIAAATERITGQPLDTRFLLLYLLIGTTLWSYLSDIFSNIAETITWERWEGTIEYTLMAPVSRFIHLIGSCVYAVTHGALRAAVVFVIVVLIFGVDLSGANFVTTAAVVALGSVSVIGLAIFVAILPLLFTERGAQMTFVMNSSLLLVSGVYYPTDVLPIWLRIFSPFSPITYVLRGVRASVLEGAGLAQVWGQLAILAAMGLVLVPASIAAFVVAERYAKRTGRLKRSG
ncbi:MAG: ABC transporter permease [Chloroflexi bacterium]|nr:ABC transporter permease [Chloroflexota bacterium]